VPSIIVITNWNKVFPRIWTR